MVLLVLTLLPISLLICIPLMQRISFESHPWQGQLAQGALWALLPVGILWTLQMLDAGHGVLALIPCIACLGLLLFGSSGGWPALLSGRLSQGALVLLSLLAFYLAAGITGMLASLVLLSLAALADSLLDRVGPAPREPSELSFEQLPLASPELSGNLVGARVKEEALPKQSFSWTADETAPVNPKEPLSDRPPLPSPGMVSRWTAEQAEMAAQRAEETGDEFKRGRRLNR